MAEAISMELFFLSANHRNNALLYIIARERHSKINKQIFSYETREDRLIKHDEGRWNRTKDLCRDVFNDYAHSLHSPFLQGSVFVENDFELLCNRELPVKPKQSENFNTFDKRAIM